MRNIVLIGASRGLGAALAAEFSNSGDRTWLLSRTEPDAPEHSDQTWIEADLADSAAAIGAVKTALAEQPIHAFIYNAGIWERDNFDKTAPEELQRILDVNLGTAIQMIRALEGNLRAGRGNLILVGSTCGLENEGANTVSYVASKFGLRGAAHALREHFRSHMVRVTCISPGSMATDIGLGESQRALETHKNKRMPVDDMVALIRCVLSLSPATCVKEMFVPATLDRDV